MTDRGRTRVKLADFKGKKADEGAIDIEMDDGSVFTIDPPTLWSDDLLREAAKGEAADSLIMAELLLGDRYAEFVAAGGSAALVNAIVGDIHGASPGE